MRKDLDIGRSGAPTKKIHAPADIADLIGRCRYFQDEGRWPPLRDAPETVKNSREQGFGHPVQIQRTPAGGRYGEGQVCRSDPDYGPGHLVTGVVKLIIGQFGKRAQTEQQKPGDTDALGKGTGKLF